MMAWRFIRTWPVVLLLGWRGVGVAQVAPPASPPSSPSQAGPGGASSQPPANVAPDVALHIAIERLREEGLEFRRSGNLPRQSPDFAETFAYFVRPDDVVDAIVNIQDRDDAAVDAYVRWQLLSFEVDLAAMEGEDFDRLLLHLPRLAPCGPVDTEMHAALERLAVSAGRNADVRLELENRWNEIHFADKQVELINQPAIKFREAVADAMPDTGTRRLGVLMVDAQERIAAASDPRNVKSRITSTLRASMNDDTISAERRWELLRYVETLAGPGTKVVRDVVFYANAPADVRYSTYAIRSSDVKKWTAYLNRHEP